MSTKPIRLLAEGSAAGMQPSHMTNPDDFTTDDKTELIDVHFATGDEKISTGIWECAPCREEYDGYPVHEMISVLSGSLTLTDADGNAQTYTAGDMLFIPKGTPCIWEITERLRQVS